MEARCPDIALIDMKNQETFIIDDVAISGDFRGRDKEVEKILIYIGNISNVEYKS